MAAASYHYYDFNGTACRVAQLGGEDGRAERYQTGEGFVPAPLMEILYHALPISRAEFDRMVLAHRRPEAKN